jgi:CBS domain-containing protein
MKYARRKAELTNARYADARGPLIGLPARARLCDVTDVLFRKDQVEFPVLEHDRVVGAVSKGELLRALSRRDPCSLVADLVALPVAATRILAQETRDKRRPPALGKAPSPVRRRNPEKGEQTSWVVC